MNARGVMALGVAVAGLIVGATARAQGSALARRVQAVQDGRVEFDAS